MNESGPSIDVMSTLPDPAVGEWRGPGGHPVRVAADELRRNLQAFLDGLGSAFTDLQGHLGGFQLRRVEITAGVTVGGKLVLLGFGTEASATGGIKLTFDVAS